MSERHTTALFDFSVERQDSTVGAKNFLTLLNPSDSGRLYSIGGVFVSYMTTVASPAYALRGFRTTAEPTGGTLHAESTICRFDTQRFAPSAVIRTGNPTATAASAIFNVAPGLIQGQNYSSTIEQVDVPVGFNPFIMYPGEAIMIRQEAGNPGHLWNISVLWREVVR